MNTPAQAFAEMVEQLAESPPDGGWTYSNLPALTDADIATIIEAHPEEAAEAVIPASIPYFARRLRDESTQGGPRSAGYFVVELFRGAAWCILLNALKEIEWDRTDAEYDTAEDTGYDTARQAQLDRETVQP
jgi:hypothetical protein